MTVEIVKEPSIPGPARSAETAPTVPAAPAGHWRAVVRLSVLVPLIVLIPLVTLTPSADHRFNIYANGGLYESRPWRLIPGVINSVPAYLRLGNFRPFGRIVEWSLDAGAFALTALLGIPANIALRVVSFAAAVVLTLAAVIFAEAMTGRGRLFRDTPSLLVVTMPFAVGAGLVAAGRTSTTVLFGGLYFLSAALVLLVAALACRVSRFYPAAFLLGAVLAAFNEMAYLAVPLATVAVLARGVIVLGQSWRDTLRGARFVLWLWLGFLPVFLPVRVLIYRICEHGACYTGSDVALPGAAGALPNRLVSWLPPLMWLRASDGTKIHLAAALPALALVALAVLAIGAARRAPRLSTLDRRQALGLAVVAGTALLLGGTLAALNSDVQAFAKLGKWGQGWRDSGLTTAAGAALALAAGTVRRRVAVLALVPLVLAGTVAVAANNGVRDGSSAGVYPYLHDRIAQEVADFDRTPAGDVRRCALRADFVKTSTANHGGVLDEAEVERFDVSIDRATVQLYGRRFGAEAPR